MDLWDFSRPLTLNRSLSEKKISEKSLSEKKISETDPLVMNKKSGYNQRLSDGGSETTAKKRKANYQGCS